MDPTAAEKEYLAAVMSDQMKCSDIPDPYINILSRRCIYTLYYYIL